MRVILCLRANFYFFIPIFARYVYKNIKQRIEYEEQVFEFIVVGFAWWRLCGLRQPRGF